MVKDIEKMAQLSNMLMVIKHGGLIIAHTDQNKNGKKQKQKPIPIKIPKIMKIRYKKQKRK